MSGAEASCREIVGATVGVVGDVVRRMAMGLDVDRLRHAMHEEKSTERHPDDDPGGQIFEDRQAEGGEKDHPVAHRRANEPGESGQLGHVPGDDGEHGASARPRCATRRKSA